MVAFAAAAPVARASLGVPTGGPPTTFSSLAAFAAAAGGADNGTTAGAQGTGFRHVTWSGVAVDGSDPGSTSIKPGHVAAVAPSRLEPWGLALGPEVAAANDSFASVNSHATGLFGSPAWAPFNSNSTEMQIVMPGGGSTPLSAQTRGLGVTFLNVQQANTTEIEYFDGDIALGHVFAPIGNTSFAGLLFPERVVNRVVITLGSATLFAFDGSNATTGGTSANTLVAGRDLVLAEPSRPAVAATAGAPVTSVLDTFTESVPRSSVTATIDWGDGSRTPGTIGPGAGGSFVVTGDHAYAQTGSYRAKVTVEDFQGPEQTSEADIHVAPRATTTNVTCSPAPIAVAAITTCTATVADVDRGSASPPTGPVSFSSTTSGGAFPQSAGCLLGATINPGVSVCAVQFSPGQLPPNQARVAATYGGDAAHAPSNATTIIGVRAQRCSLRTLSRRLRPAGLGVLVTCDARANVRITANAVAARRGSARGFQVRFGSLRSAVSAGRPTVLVIKPSPAVLRTLRTALGRHQHVSLKLTLTASSHATQRTTTTRLPALRLAPTGSGSSGRSAPGPAATRRAGTKRPPRAR